MCLLHAGVKDPGRGEALRDEDGMASRDGASKAIEVPFRGWKA